MNRNEPLSKEDYAEPRCLLCDPQTGLPAASASLPMQRITEKLDDYCDRQDFAGAERHLLYWLREAQEAGDLRGAFSLQNEMMGFYRKQGRKEQALEHVTAALSLMEVLGNEDSIAGGTCYVNCGTVCDQFGMPEEALSYFARAQKILEPFAGQDPYRLGSLYNNMALARMDLKQYPEARRDFRKALAVMEQIEGSELEQAITWMNMADTAALEKGLEEAEEEIHTYVKNAAALIGTKSLPRDGYYAFVCEKCIPGFYCYGFSETAAELERQAEAIYIELKNKG